MAATNTSPSGRSTRRASILRFTAEYFREPDSFLGLRAFELSQGQWLSLPMVAAGAALWWWAGRRRAALP
jgi:phosphatidylglycerol:prolipoprotein diacylglycerol transferase